MKRIMTLDWLLLLGGLACKFTKVPFITQYLTTLGLPAQAEAVGTGTHPRKLGKLEHESTHGICNPPPQYPSYLFLSISARFAIHIEMNSHSSTCNQKEIAIDTRCDVLSAFSVCLLFPYYLGR